MLRRSGASKLGSRYQIVGPLGSGGFGAVYEAIDEKTGQRVAIKELGDDAGDNVSRFKQEFRALADCHHVNLVGLRELIEQDGQWLIVMEFVPGTDFLGHVARSDNDNQWSCDEARLRKALMGVVEGLAALHGYGILHRDLKPANLRVTPEGRAVLLDFGLVTSVNPLHQSTHAMPMGTVAYMAPEQALARPLDERTDLYALGVCLFEALTGRLPFEGTNALDILMRKQREAAPRASELAPGVPRDLDELTSRLLAIEPNDRPSMAELRALIGAGSDEPQRALGPQVEETFAGRDGELRVLQRALARTHQGELRIVLVEGESGVGKSELVAEFLRRAKRTHPELLALQGRCYENEQVSYKAFDGCVDELAKMLKRLPDAACAALLPVRAALLAQLFPVLRTVKAIAISAREGSSADPTARRLEAFEALSRLLAKIAEERPLVLVVDDLQWADAESFRLLQALVESALPAPLLIVATIRPRVELEPMVLEQTRELRKWNGSSVVELVGLPEPQARELARKLLAREVPDAWLTMIAKESEGHPLFLSELVQYSGSFDLTARHTVTLEDALRARIERLDPEARELLELIALAGRPHGAHVFARALARSNVDDASRSLLSIRLLRARKGQELGCYHDRIRHTAVSLIARSRLAGLHRKLANALVQADDASEPARHFDLAGEVEQAIDAYERAAGQALEALAFQRADELYKRAMVLIEDANDARMQRMRVQRARALACYGRHGDAAQLYGQAAERADGNVRIELRSRAAQHVILSARIGAGYGALLDVLRDLGFALPRSLSAKVARFAWEALRIAFARALPLRAHGQATHDFGLQIMGSSSSIVAVLDVTDYLLLIRQAVRRGLRSDSALDRARSITWRAWHSALQGSLGHALALFADARALFAGHSDPITQATAAFLEGSACIAGWDWAAASLRLEPAQKLLQEKCPDDAPLLLSVRYHLGGTWYNLGEHARLARELSVWMAEARERNDVLSVALLAGMGHGSIRHLMEDAPERARIELDDALAPIPAAPFSFPHLGRLVAMVYTLLYEGGSGALRFLAQERAEHGRSLLLRSGAGRNGLNMLGTLARLSAATTAHAEERASLLADAAKRAAKLARSSSPFVSALGELLLAQVKGLRGQSADALAHARSARAAFDALNHFHRFAARYLEGLLEGGASGREKCESATGELAAQGWRVPARALLISAPTHALLAGAQERPSSRALLAGRYEIREQMSGGFGSVVRARDVTTDRTVALKELTRRGAMSLERFKHEFRTLRDLAHPNLVQVEALFEHEGTWYMAMELVEGVDLLEWSRPNGTLDLARFEQALAGVVAGLMALHEAGFVHRDLTPENIRVMSDGRAVLIDLGLSARREDRAEQAPSGSIAYASPEQLEGTPPHESADVYALGSCLYHALTGRAPFEGSAGLPLGVRKRRERPTLPRGVAQLPVGEVVTRMVSPAPSERPTLREIAVQLSLASDGARLGSVRPFEAGSQEAGFAGREDELERLDERFEQSCDEGLTVMLVSGESGLGKSALVSEFARRAQAQSPRVVVLRSRCYENELIAHKAFDGAVDQLAQLLRSLPNPRCEAFLPKNAALLAQLFPVLASVPAIEQAPKKGLPADPSARGLAARTAFVALLEKLGAEYELLFVVDDLQWADMESFRLLTTLLEHARALPFLLVATVRPAAEIEDEPVARALSELSARAEVSELTLSGLSEQDATELAHAYFGAPLSAQASARMVAESKGHPLFLRELVAEERRGNTHTPSLDGVLRARIDGFAGDARALLSVVALAGRPHKPHVFARAIGLRALPREAVLALLAHGFLARRGAQELTCYHDRIRRVALDMLAEPEQRRLASELARALEAEPDRDAAECARLWELAGRSEQAANAYEQAGDRALEALAFLRAEQHYARALAQLGGAPSERRRRLLVQRGHALVRAGRSAEAAQAYEQASEGAAGELAVRLRLWAAQHLLQSAQIETGLQAADALLRELGESLPANERAALVRVGWERARMKLRGVALSARKRVLSSAERMRLEALQGLASPVGAAGPLAGMALALRYLRGALDAGDPALAARALAGSAMWRAVSNPSSDPTALFEHSRKLADASGDPALIAQVEIYWGIACLQNRRRAAAMHLSIAHELLESRCPGEPWATTTARMYLSSDWYMSGDWALLPRRTGRWLDDARERDDRYALAALSGFGAGALRHVMNGRADDALAELEQALAPWPRAHFSALHFGEFYTRSAAQVAAHDVAMFAQLERDDAALRKPAMMRVPTARFSLHFYRLLAVLLPLEPGRASRAADAMRVARREVDALTKVKTQVAPGTALLGLAVLEALAGDPDRARVLAEQADQELETTGHHCAAGSRYLLATLRGGEEARTQREAVLASFREQGFRDPRQGLAMCLPGAHLF